MIKSFDSFSFRSQVTEDQKAPRLLEQLERESRGESADEEQEEVEGARALSALHETTEGETVGEEARSREQEEFQKVPQMKLQDERDSSLEQVWLPVLYVLIYS